MREVVGRLKVAPDLIGYLPFRAERLAYQSGPPEFDPIPYLGPELRMFFRDPKLGRFTRVGPPDSSLPAVPRPLVRIYEVFPPLR